MMQISDKHVHRCVIVGHTVHGWTFPVWLMYSEYQTHRLPGVTWCYHMSSSQPLHPQDVSDAAQTDRSVWLDGERSIKNLTSVLGVDSYAVNPWHHRASDMWGRRRGVKDGDQHSCRAWRWLDESAAQMFLTSLDGYGIISIFQHPQTTFVPLFKFSHQKHLKSVCALSPHTCTGALMTLMIKALQVCVNG